MPFPRSDLALEQHRRAPHSSSIEKEEELRKDCKITRIRVNKSVQGFNKPPGIYVTIRLPDFLSSQPPDAFQAQLLSDELKNFLPKEGAVLILGLGNAQITPDALGSRTTRHILTTRGRNAIEGLPLREVCAIAPGVLAQTGMESREILSGLITELHPAAVIAVDALAAAELNRLGNTIQISDSGISPGSGVENSRPELSADTLGVPVIAIGVPTVIDYPLAEGSSYFVAPRDIDLLAERAARLIALGINLALQPYLSAEDLLFLTAE